MKYDGTIAERIFTDICASKYLKGFVFHSPKIKERTEIEIGDIVIWVRTQLTIFEMISRDPNSSAGFNSFKKRIGEKRDQLQNDYNYYSSLDNDIILTNENGNKITFQKIIFVKQGFIGIVLVDIDLNTLKLHYGTIEKCFTLDFPNHIIHYKGFLKILHELDTTSDLYFYFLDRYRFLPFIFKNKPELLLTISEDFEANLLAFYKMNLNSFPENKFDFIRFTKYWDNYNVEFKERINSRNSENKDSYIIDDIIQRILSFHTSSDDGKLFAWELATLTRRQRATYLAEKVEDAFYMLKNGNEKRFFAYYNEYTSCWILFYFRHGVDTITFRIEFERLLRLKTIYESITNNFKYSTFGYGFRKSPVITPNSLFDDFAMTIQDVDNLGPISSEEIEESKLLFGHMSSTEIEEFPIK